MRIAGRSLAVDHRLAGLAAGQRDLAAVSGAPAPKPSARDRARSKVAARQAIRRAVVADLVERRLKDVGLADALRAGDLTLHLDNNGRLLIPKDLMGFAGITKDIVLTSQINKIEIWDKASYDQVLSDDSIDFGTLAEDVMGDIDNITD